MAAPRVSVPVAGPPAGYGEQLENAGFTGFADLSIPLPITPGIRGEPQIALRYSSGGAPRGVFGRGFSLDVPSIALRTNQGVPSYDGSDAVALAGAPLVPRYEHRDGRWVKAQEHRTRAGEEFLVIGYRRREEGEFALIEQWLAGGGSHSFWRVLDGAGTTLTFGLQAEARIQDPESPERIAEWLLESVVDRHGNTTSYEYKREDGEGVPTRVSEHGRDTRANRYLARVRWGDYRDGEGHQRFACELALNYGEYDPPAPDPVRPWAVRPDPFSVYRCGFEVRTHRRVRSVLMIHRLPEEGVESVVGALHLHYEQGGGGSLLSAVRREGVRVEEGGEALTESLPPITFGYSPFAPAAQRFQPLATAPHPGPAPGPLDADAFRLVDLHGDGLAGILHVGPETQLYWPPLGNGHYGPAQPLPAVPSEWPQSGGQIALLDLEGAGHLDLLLAGAQRGGYYGNRGGGAWSPFQTFASYPPELGAPAGELSDVAGDGRPGLLLAQARSLRYYASRGREGFAAPLTLARDPGLPLEEAATARQLLTQADVFGDGLPHRLRVADGLVRAWPDLGHGRFGAPVTLGGAPRFAEELPLHILAGDVSGNGLADLVLVYSDRVDLHLNRAGNELEAAISIPLPVRIDDLDHVQLADVTGSGVSAIVLSRGGADLGHSFLDLSPAGVSGLLVSIEHGTGTRTELAYRSSTDYALADRAAGQPWRTRLAFPVQVLERTQTFDRISMTTTTETFQYRDGYFDPLEREFRGFGYLQRLDAEASEPGIWHFPRVPTAPASAAGRRPALVRTWFATGALATDTGAPGERAPLQWDGDPEALVLPAPTLTAEIRAAGIATIRQAYLAQAGTILRKEVFGMQGANLAPTPYLVEQSSPVVTLVQPPLAGEQAVVMLCARESARSEYEQISEDPRITHRFVLEHDPYGHPILEALASYPRRRETPQPGQRKLLVSVEQITLANHPGPDWNLLGMAVAEEHLELDGIAPEGRYFSWAGMGRSAAQALAVRVPYGDPFVPGVAQARAFRRAERRYWNAECTAPLPLGELAPQALLHHDREAVFPSGFAERVSDGKMTTALLVGRGYVHDEGLWWCPGAVHRYGDAAAHWMLTGIIDPFGGVTALAYDAPYGLALLACRDALGHEQRVTIDYQVLRPRLLRTVNGDIREVLFDALGEVIASSQHGVRDGAPVGNAPLEQFIRHPRARLSEVLADPERFLQGATTFVLYEPQGEPSAEQPPYRLTLTRRSWVNRSDPDELPPSIALDYFDGLARPIAHMEQVETAALALEGEQAPGAQGLVWVVERQVAYDSRSEILHEWHPFTRASPSFGEPPSPVTSFDYDPLGRQTRVLLPGGWERRRRYGAWAIRDYDEQSTDPHSPFWELPRTSAVDVRGRVIEEERLLAYPGEALQRLCSAFVLDVAGNRLRTIDPRFYDPLHPDHAEHYAQLETFDMRSRPLVSVGADAGTQMELADVLDEPAVAWNARGDRREWSYDVLRRPSTVRVEEADGSRCVERFLYGEDPQRGTVEALVRRDDEGGTATILEYDLDGEWTSATRHLLADPRTPVDWSDPEHVALMAETWSMARSHGPSGELLRETTPDGADTSIETYRNGWVESVGTRFALGEEPVVAARGATYDAAGRPRGRELGNGARWHARYDERTLRLTALGAEPSAEGLPPLQDLRFTRDRVGNVTEVIDAAPPPHGGRIVDELASTFAYDSLYRLRHASGWGQPQLLGQLCAPAATPSPSGEPLVPYSEAYSYDRSGNVRAVALATGGHDALCRMSTALASDRTVPERILQGDPPERFFAAGGEQISLEPLGEERRLIYDDRGCLIRAPGPLPGEMLAFLYDEELRLLRRALYRDAPAGATLVRDTLYLGRLTVERLPGRVIEALSVEVEDELVLLTLSEGGTRQARYQLTDQVSSVLTELGEDQLILTHETYSPYGRTVVALGDQEQLGRKRLRFAGKELDETIGLYAFGPRWYAPWQTRWNRPDPLGAVDGLNRYLYVRDNPATAMDPSGLVSKTRSGQRRHNRLTRANRAPMQFGRRITGAHTNILDPASLIDLGAALAETRPGGPITSVMPSRRDVSASGGWVRYGAIVAGRRMGVTARITPSMIRQGRPATYSFPFLRRRTGYYLVRGHLLARVLGGAGNDARNFVPLFHGRNNIPMYNDIERRIQRYVLRRMQAVIVNVVPIYGHAAGPLSVLPTAIRITARDAQTGATILGRPFREFDTGL